LPYLWSFPETTSHYLGEMMLPNVGDRIEIDFDDPEFPHTLTKGARGTVESINSANFDGKRTITQIWVLWDKQRNCIALIPERGDKFHLIEKSAADQVTRIGLETGLDD
jgi:hypothetical protein